eukprot:TRINITY_DN1266_c0_g1_i2.p1 TRINITY_DN1266_c0_g1~~TRINITY_DN1266_c0_g1_i2.p1  ORF type:complete len:115 (-),score=40.46 TRINITY_DN1266_c0_g1_i2:26-370(-)
MEELEQRREELKKQLALVEEEIKQKKRKRSNNDLESPKKKRKIDKSDDVDPASRTWKLGTRNKEVRLNEFKGNKYVHIREYKNDKPMKGIALTIDQWKLLVQSVEEVQEQLENL